MPKELNDIYRQSWSERAKNPTAAFEQAFEYISNNYDGQLALKRILDKNKGYMRYSAGNEVIKDMIKHYTQYREKVQVDYFTCDTNPSWPV